VKTTLQIPDDLYRDVKTAAAISGRSITSILEESLRMYLADAAAVQQLPPLPVSRSLGGFTDEFLATGIDFNNTGEVLAWLDKDKGQRP
jgi:hypothetical protein